MSTTDARPLPTFEAATRLQSQMTFLVELDKLKSVMRQTPLIHARRRENSAEHSWHVALAAIVLAEHTTSQLDLARVVKMLLIHDVVEIDSGDVFIHDEVARNDVAAAESAAARRLFGLLPKDTGREFLELWEEYDARFTAEARYAYAIDRFLPLLYDFHTRGMLWAEHGIRRDQVIDITRAIERGSPSLWHQARDLIDRATDLGYLAR